MVQLQEELQKQCEDAIRAYSDSLPQNNLHEPVKYILSLGGKRIRPILVMLAGNAFQADERQLLNAALAVEIFHNFSLVHDDIMDRAPLRRGKKTVHKKWDENTGILSGDAMLIEAYKQLTLAGGKHIGKLLDLFNTTSIEVCEGQQLDMDFENRTDVKVEDYLEMIRLKTAVLLGCSLKMGAILGDASGKNAEHLYNFGIHAGIGFQIQDDFLDAFGDPEKVGKQVGGDILSNKKTYLIIKALDLANDGKREELENIYFRDAIAGDGEKVSRVLTIFGELEIDKITREESLRHFQLAQKELDSTTLSEDQKIRFSDFIEMLQGRRK